MLASFPPGPEEGEDFFRCRLALGAPMLVDSNCWVIAAFVDAEVTLDPLVEVDAPLPGDGSPGFVPPPDDEEPGVGVEPTGRGTPPLNVCEGPGAGVVV